MKLKSIAVLAVMIVASSCGINDLEDRVGRIEKTLGTNEPLTVEFATENSNNVAINKNATYYFKPGGDEEYMGIVGTTVYVEIERFSDVEWYEGAYIYFEYDTETKEISDPEVTTYFNDQFGTYRNYEFYSWSSGATINVKVNSINIETGKIDVSVEASTTANYGYNEYSGKPMTGSFRFKGKLPVFDWNN